MGLLLRAVDIAGPLHWRWTLSDQMTGRVIAGHDVDLSGARDEVARLANLYGHISWYAAPDRRVPDGARIVAAAGEWAGRVLLGPDVTRAIAASAETAPVTVTVSAAPPTDYVLLWPLELAHVPGPEAGQEDGSAGGRDEATAGNSPGAVRGSPHGHFAGAAADNAGRPLAASGDVTFVYELDGAGRGTGQPGGFAAARLVSQKEPVAGRLRILAVFSQPAATDVLALRKERYELARLIHQLAARSRAAIELRVVQYGTTRERLRQIADDGEGWDVLHLSGHGGGGAFLLEHPDGEPDLVSSADLVGLLRPARRRVKLAVVSACESAADATAQAYRLLGLTEQAETLEQAEAIEEASAAEQAEAFDRAAGSARTETPEQAGATAAVPAARQEVPAARPAKTSIPGLARTLARDLGSPVVAMRYPVADDFAIAYSGVLYDQLLSRGNRLDIAAARALAEAARPAPSAARPPLSVATPGLFAVAAGGQGDGQEAAAVTASGTAVRLLAPTAPPDFGTVDRKMTYFAPPYGPGEPARFVGRAAAMARASTALAPGSGRTAVLLHGMAGSGKTTCALELAYRHQDAFAALAFWQAPTRESEWQGALANLAIRLEAQLGQYGFTMAGHIGTDAALAAYLPVLRETLRGSGILLVLDNLETLLTPDGTWRDPRFGLVIGALTDHDGESRVILTSRIRPAGIEVPGVVVPGAGQPARGARATLAPDPRVLTLPVHALSLGESVALARELDNLGALLHADAGPVRDDPARSDPGASRPLSEEQIAADRDLVRRVLRVVQGHPKLMELADAAAADRDLLTAHLDAAENAHRLAEEATRRTAAESAHPSAEEDVNLTAAETAHVTAGEGGSRVTGTAADSNGGALAAFFRDGESTLDPGQFLAALSAWTVTALGVLPADARLMAEFVACLEDGDRRAGVVAANWTALWQRLNRTGEPPDPLALLATLVSAALVEAEPASGAGARNQAGTDVNASVGRARPDLMTLRMHPGVAAAVIEAARPDVREAVDAQMAAFWYVVSKQAREREGGEDGALMVRAGLAAAPYLLRYGDLRLASFLLEHATVRDASPGVTQTVLPLLRRIAAATQAPVDAGALGRVLMRVDPAEAERLLRGAMEAAAAGGDYRAASGIAGELGNLLMGRMLLREALATVQQKQEFTRRAGLGPWTQLLDHARRLQVLGMMGDHAQVIAEVDRLREVMAGLPSRMGPDEAVNPWNVREVILGTGRSSALAMEEWERCLELNAEDVASKKERGAGEHEVTRIQFNDAGPLIQLGRLDEAGRLLADCQRIAEDHADTARLVKILGARANLESSRSHWSTAVDLQQAALRLSYMQAELRDVAISHYNLANYLRRLGGGQAVQRAHRLAAALVYRLTGMSHDLAISLRVLVQEVGVAGGTDPSLPITVAQVIDFAEQTEGVRLGALLGALEPDPAKVEAALAEILAVAASLSEPSAGEPAP